MSIAPLPSSLYLKQAIERHVARTGKTRADIARDAGFGARASQYISMITDESPIPIDRVPGLARAVSPEVDFATLALMRLQELHPETWGFLRSEIEAVLPSAAEASILSAIDAAARRNGIAEFAAISTEAETELVEQFVMSLGALQAEAA
jgi:hypothetical protein